MIVRLVAPADSTEHREQIQATLQTCERFLGGGRGDQLTLGAQTEHIRRLCLERLSRLASYSLHAGVMLFSPGESDEVVADVLGQSLSGDSSRSAETSPFTGGFSVSKYPLQLLSDAFAVGDTDPHTVEEAACAFRLPLISGEEENGMPVRRNRTVRASLPANDGDESAGSSFVAMNRHRGELFPVHVPLDHRFKHSFIFGMTGTGKTTLMRSLLFQDLRQGHGVCLIDPHGELADEVLSNFPQGREDDLIVADSADRQSIVPMNFIRWSNIDERDVILDDLYCTLDRAYDFRQTGGPVFEQNFRAMLKLLMQGEPNADPTFTLLELPLLYQNTDFRKYLISRSKEDQTKDFIKELEDTRGECSINNLAPYITSKFSRFIQDRILRCVVGHGDMRLDFEQILNSRKVLILKLGRGRFGVKTAELLLGLLLSRFRAAVMSRADMPKPDRPPFFLYVDELGSLARDENFVQLLSEARKYRVSLTMATQYASQLGGNAGPRNVLSAILGNVGTVVSFRVGVEDAPQLAPVFGPVITAQDLAEVPNFQGYMRFHLDGGIVRPFSFETTKPSAPTHSAQAEDLLTACRKRWGVSQEECEQLTAARRKLIRSLE
jgi:hypothetical protein